MARIPTGRHTALLMAALAAVSWALLLSPSPVAAARPLAAGASAAEASGSLVNDGRRPLQKVVMTSSGVLTLPRGVNWEPDTISKEECQAYTRNSAAAAGNPCRWLADRQWVYHRCKLVICSRHIIEGLNCPRWVLGPLTGAKCAEIGGPDKITIDL